MKRLTVLLFTALFTVIGITTTSAKEVQLASKNYSVKSFSAIEANTVADIVYTQSDITSVRVNGIEEMMDHLTIRVHDGVLFIENSVALDNNFNTPLVVFVTSPQLDSIKNNGVGNWCLKGRVKSDELHIVSNGIGSIHALELQSEKIVVDYDAIGTLKLGGNTKVVEIKSTGVGTIDCKNLLAETALVKSSKSGNVNCFASKNIGLYNDGIGEITYHGNPSFKSLNNGGLGRIIAAK